MPQLNTTELLKNVYLFNDLSQVELEKILGLAYDKQFGKEEAIFHEGELGDALYIVMEGAQAGRLFRRDGPDRRLPPLGLGHRP